MDKNQFDTICKKLDKITIVLATQGIENKDEKISLLKKAGLTSDDISPLVGIKNVRDTKGWKGKTEDKITKDQLEEKNNGE